MALVTSPTRGSQVVNQEVASSLTDTMLPIRYVHSIASPTFKILWANRITIKVGPDRKIRGNFFHGSQDVWVAGGSSFHYPLRNKETLSQIEYDVPRMGSSTSISEEDMTDYAGENSLFDLAVGRVDEMHQGFTEAWKYTPWSRFGIGTTEVKGDEIDLDDFMDNKPGVKIFGDVSDNAARVQSLPQVIRNESATDGSTGTATRHVFGNLSSANPTWNAHVFYEGDVTISDTGNNYTDGIVSAITGTKAVTEKIVTNALDHLQIGDDYTVYVPMASAIYSSVRRQLRSQDRGSMDNPLTTLGITKAIAHPDYNAVFYAEPMMNNPNMWPNSIFGFDTNHTFLCCVRGYEPKEIPWQQVGFSNTMGAAEYIRGQLVCIDRRSTFAIHGVHAA